MGVILLGIEALGASPVPINRDERVVVWIFFGLIKSAGGIIIRDSWDGIRSFRNQCGD